jgi:hypothetical protein
MLLTPEQRLLEETAELPSAFDECTHEMRLHARQRMDLHWRNNAGTAARERVRLARHWRHSRMHAYLLKWGGHEKAERALATARGQALDEIKKGGQ